MKTTLERPDLFIKFKQLANAKGLLLQHGQEAAKDADYQPPIAFLIRTKNDATGLPRLLEHVAAARKSYKGRIDVVVTDTESTDQTLSFAKAFGATIVPVKQEGFSYPATMNAGLAQVKPDVVATFITVGHAQPCLSNCLQAAIRHFKDPSVIGACGYSILHENASIWESVFFRPQRHLPLPAHPINTPTVGVMGATNCMVRMATWRKHPFDTTYAHGGEDTAWAAWGLKQGYKFIREPAMTVHHTHGLGPINLWRQSNHWKEVSQKPEPFDQTAMKKRRPDLFKK